MFLQSESFLLNKSACVRCNLQPIMSTYTYTASPLYANGLFIHCCIVTYIRIQCLYQYKTDKQTTNRNLCFVFTVRAFLKNKLISQICGVQNWTKDIKWLWTSKDVIITDTVSSVDGILKCETIAWSYVLNSQSLPTKTFKRVTIHS